MQPVAPFRLTAERRRNRGNPVAIRLRRCWRYRRSASLPRPSRRPLGCGLDRRLRRSKRSGKRRRARDRPDGAAAGRTRRAGAASGGRSKSMLNQRCACTPQAMSHSVNASPGDEGDARPSCASIMPVGLAASAIPWRSPPCRACSGRCAHQAPEHRPHRPVQHRLLRVHPVIDVAARCGSCGHSGEPGACAVAQVAQDGRCSPTA